MNYYNEWDKFAAEWLKQLIKDGLIPDGEVDNRSIVDVEPGELKGFTQCHFFAGIGGWSRALQLAGWSSDRPVWTGSPPCQSFSTAGKGKGKDDERHLWPVFFNLIRECQPTAVFGEQVAAAIRHGWLDDLQDDFEAEGYASGAVVLPSGSIGAFHKGTDYSLPPSAWPTPTAATGGASKNPENKRGIHGGNPMATAASLVPWPTPSTRDHKGGYKGGRIRNGKISTDTLDVAAQLTPWATPTATDHSRGTKPPRPQDTGIPLTQQVSGLTHKPSIAETESTVPSQLNPRFSLWLMGYPIEWGFSGERVTPLSRKRQRKS